MRNDYSELKGIMASYKKAIDNNTVSKSISEYVNEMMLSPKSHSSEEYLMIDDIIYALDGDEQEAMILLMQQYFTAKDKSTVLKIYARIS